MIVYRFSHRKFAKDISGIGAMLNGGRWNEIGIPVLYTGSTISLALLETLVNANTLDQLKMLQLMEIVIPDDAAVFNIRLESLKKDWKTDFGYSKYLGTEILKSNEYLLIECPSAVVCEERNFLINPQHAAFRSVQLRESKHFVFDERLFKYQ